MNQLVSVIIPTYNRKEFLLEAVRSVEEGSFRDFELIVIDDGSTDGTTGALGGLEKKLRYHYQPNRGVSAARNLGVAISRGRYVAFLDSDDLWMKDKLRRQITFMEKHPDKRLCHTDEIWIRNGVRVNQGKRHQKVGGDIFLRCLPLCVISPSSVLMERSLFVELDGFDEELQVCEDYDLWLRLTSRHRVGFIEEPMVVKRGGHGDQLSKAHWGIDRFRIRALAGLILRGEVGGMEREAVLGELEKKCRIVAGGSRKRGREVEARMYEFLPDRLARYEAPGSALEEMVGDGSFLPTLPSTGKVAPHLP